MIRNFIHKGLERYFTKSDRRGIDANHALRIRRLLDRLDGVNKAEDMNIPGYKFHPLKGDRKGSYAVTDSGNWRITFKFEDGDAINVSLEDYH